MALIDNIYKSFINAGFSQKQARALTAEVGRENNFSSKYVFGSHKDAANSKINIGFLSWQGERGEELLNNLKSKGLFKNNRIVESQEALDEMARYTMHEIKNKKSYSKTKDLFLSNPNISQQDASEVLGRNFIRWDMDGKYIKDVASHKKRRDKFYNMLGDSTQIQGEAIASQTSQPQEERTVIQPIDLNSPEYSGTVFSEQTDEEPQQQKEPTVEQTAQELLDESFLEEFQAQQLQEQIPQQQVQDYPQYNIEVKPIEYQPIQMQNGGNIPISSNGLWEYPHQQVIVPTHGEITMKNVNYPTFGKSIETGEIKLMLPSNNYFFNNTKNVLETPLFKYEEE